MPPRPAPSDAGLKPGLRFAARGACWLGALLSLAFTLYAGRHNPSILLDVLFAGWVLLPYFGLIAADRASARARRDIARAIHASTLLLAVIPPAIYAAVSILAPGHPSTFAFLAVPFASWLAIATILIAVRLQHAR